jgi:hypothetical protein
MKSAGASEKEGATFQNSQKKANKKYLVRP